MNKLSVLKYAALLSMLCLASCTTYSVTMVHSTGQASDVVDETQTMSPSTSVEATASVPASVIP